MAKETIGNVVQVIGPVVDIRSNQRNCLTC